MLCKATRSDGQPCRKLAIRGGEVCATHGGSTQHIKRAASRRLAEAQAQDAARRQLVRRHAPQDPEEEARELVALAKAQVAELSARLAAHPEEQALLSPALGSWVKLTGDLNAQWARLRTSEATGDAEWANEPRVELLRRLDKLTAATPVSPPFVAEVLGLLEQARGQPEVECPAVPALPAPQADVAEVPTVEAAATPESPAPTDEPPRPPERVVPLPLPARAVTYERMGPFARPVTDPLSGLWTCPVCGHESAGGASACIGCGAPRERYEPA